MILNITSLDYWVAVKGLMSKSLYLENSNLSERSQPTS